MNLLPKVRTGTEITQKYKRTYRIDPDMNMKRFYVHHIRMLI